MYTRSIGRFIFSDLVSWGCGNCAHGDIRIFHQFIFTFHNPNFFDRINSDLLAVLAAVLGLEFES